MKILAIIPARAGSKRLPGKNKKKLAGKELVRYAIEAALQSTEITDCLLSSDDDDILAIGEDYESLICLRRPTEIAGDQALAITYVEHALQDIGKPFDYIVIIQPTSPFTTSTDIDHTIGLMHSGEADSAVSIVKLDHAIHPLKLKVMKGQRLLPFLEEEQGRMAAHELPELYVRNGSVYVSTLETIQAGKIIGDICVAYEMPRERSLDINDPLDFAFAEFLLAREDTP